ncbi:hypothetical protein LguiA_007854 [Lonicera macranthoides]
MRLYAVVSLIGDPPLTRRKTHVDKTGGRRPHWNTTVEFRIPEHKLRQNCLMLVFQLRCQRTLGGDKDVGCLYVPVKELFDGDSSGSLNFPRSVAIPVNSKSGNTKGVLYLSYVFGESDDMAVSVCAPSAPPYLEAAEGYFPAIIPAASAPYGSII